MNKFDSKFLGLPLLTFIDFKFWHISIKIHSSVSSKVYNKQMLEFKTKNLFHWFSRENWKEKFLNLMLYKDTGTYVHKIIFDVWKFKMSLKLNSKAYCVTWSKPDTREPKTDLKSKYLIMNPKRSLNESKWFHILIQ